ncbi:MAG: hypothetical protein HWQ35_01675 [Nostoc sp. NMS1]|uniref:hypothetical protein n=1 Tax=unclassified Nostoc TaxID=2593658 RepID=UPI0025F2EE5B|nr:MULTISPECIES: hypothetical protein [unclassified Nostoc]MBN3905330.1 hypothetical protein [Nostoc sp. NMS1]MBN3989464.1 hypothetical protein [Nostoc sp. NMS2]
MSITSALSTSIYLTSETCLMLNNQRSQTGVGSVGSLLHQIFGNILNDIQYQLQQFIYLISWQWH